MQKRICPVCDQVMHSAHYCRNCHSWVKNPWIRDVTYYLNERHPEDEAWCSYHGGRREEAAPSGGRIRTEKADQRTAQPRTAAAQTRPVSQTRSYGQTQSSGQTRSSSPKRPARSKKEKDRRASIWGVVIVILFYLLANAGSLISETFHDLGSFFGHVPEPEYEQGAGEYYGDEEFWDYEELEDEQVRAEGIPCNSQIHIPVDGRELTVPMAALLEQYGVAVEGTSVYSSNQRYDTGETAYSTWYDFDMPYSETGDFQYVELEWDTADDSLHGLSIYMEDLEQAATVTCGFLQLLTEHGENQDVTGRKAELDSIYSDMVQEMQERGMYSYQAGGIAISGMSFDSMYSVWISGTE